MASNLFSPLPAASPERGVKGTFRFAQADKPGGHSWAASNPFSPLPAASPQPRQRGASLRSARQTGRAFVDGF